MLWLMRITRLNAGASYFLEVGVDLSMQAWLASFSLVRSGRLSRAVRRSSGSHLGWRTTVAGKTHHRLWNDDRDSNLKADRQTHGAARSVLL